MIGVRSSTRNRSRAKHGLSGFPGVFTPGLTPRARPAGAAAGRRRPAIGLTYFCNCSYACGLLKRCEACLIERQISGGTHEANQTLRKLGFRRESRGARVLARRLRGGGNDQDRHGAARHRARRGQRQIRADRRQDRAGSRQQGGRRARQSQVELVTEDDQTTNPGAVLAFSKLAAQPDIVAFLGSIRSTQNHAMAPDILKTASLSVSAAPIPR